MAALAPAQSNEELLKSSLAEAKALEDKRFRLNRESNLLQSNSTFDRALAERLKGELGVGNYEKTYISDRNKYRGGNMQKQLERAGRDSDAALGGAVQSRLRDYTSQQQALRERALGAYKGVYGEREAKALGSLESEGAAADAAIQNQLGMQLEDAGLRGDMARQQAGALMASRGMLRSTQTTDVVGELTLEEQEQKAQSRVGAAQSQQGVRSAIDQQKQQIARQREKTNFTQDLSQLQSIDELSFNFDTDALNKEINAELEKMQSDYQKGSMLKKFAGTLLGSAAGFAIGGPAGAAMGGKVGGAAGSAL